MIDVFKAVFSGIVSTLSNIVVFGISLWDLSIGFTVLGISIAAFRSFFQAGGGGE